MGRKQIIQSQILCKSKSEMKQRGLLKKKTCLRRKAKFGLNLGSYCDYFIPVIFVTAKDYKDKEARVCFYDA